MSEQEEPTVTLVVKSFPEELHRALKIASAADGQEMREIVRLAVERELARRARAGSGRRR